MRPRRHLPDPQARRRAARALLSRPELVQFHRPTERPGTDARWKLTDTFIMVVAAMRVLLPYVLLILASVFAAWGLFWLLFL